jgi:hypothetical protein
MRQVMYRLKFKLAAAKTLIGKISRGFDFLGYRIGAQGIIGIAKRSMQKHNERKAKLYEQGASDQRIQAYVGPLLEGIMTLRVQGCGLW